MKEYKNLNPADFGLNSRVKLVLLTDKNIGIVKTRKSRIVMKDGGKIVSIASKIREKNPETAITLVISGPICSKTIKYLKESDINFTSVEEL